MASAGTGVQQLFTKEVIDGLLLLDKLIHTLSAFLMLDILLHSRLPC